MGWRAGSAPPLDATAFATPEPQGCRSSTPPSLLDAAWAELQVVIDYCPEDDVLPPLEYHFRRSAQICIQIEYGSLGDNSHPAVVSALENLLQEDSQVVVVVLDTLSDLNAHLQEQAVTVAISCIRTIHADQMPHLLRFLLLAATPVNAGRIISQICEQLKFVGVVDPRAARSKKLKKLKGKASATSTDGAILHALRSGLRFKNMLCEAFLKELKSVDHPKDHKVIDVWLIMLIYANGGALQKSAEKILKSKILQGYIRDTLFNQCICGNTELVKDHFMSYLSVSDYLLACKEEKAREFATYLVKIRNLSISAK